MGLGLSEAHLAAVSLEAGLLGQGPPARQASVRACSYGGPFPLTPHRGQCSTGMGAPQ